VQIVFQTYHAMVGIGMVLIGLAVVGIGLLRKGRLFQIRWLLWTFVGAVALPQIANQIGWISAEIGRQPWIVYGILRRVDGLSRVVNASQVLWSIIMFGLIYALLLALFVFLLDRKIKHGPVADEEDGKSDKPLVEGRRA
jgi:cytochrome d ubiquinol oxidase subunit I